MAKEKHMTEIPRSVLEATARVMGPKSAAARALADADSYDGETTFFRHGARIMVKKTALSVSRWN
jgi:hypothetical protein